MSYEVLIQPEAEGDLEEIYRFIARDSVAAARQWMERLEEAAQSLGEFPARCPVAPENDSFEEEIRHLIIGNYRVRRGSKPGNPVSNHAFFLGGGGGPSPASAATRGLPLLGA